MIDMFPLLANATDSALQLIQNAGAAPVSDTHALLNALVNNPNSALANNGFNLMGALDLFGAFSAIAFAAIGSAAGCGVAGTAAIGCWKKCYLTNKPAPFQLLIFAGAPFSQVIYGMLVMFMILNKFTPAPTHSVGLCFLLIGIFTGLAMGVASYYQGVASAAAADALADSGKGFALYLMVIGIVETVSIFAMVFAIVLISKANAFLPAV